MFCPHCGQQQVSDITRFCSRCGFPMESVSIILSSGGQLPTPYLQPGFKQLSPRSKGIRQGALLMLSTILLVPLMAIISVFFHLGPALMVPITAMICFVGGLLRIVYALLMEDPNPPLNLEPGGSYTTPAMGQFGQFARAPDQRALPPPPANTAPSRSHPNTAEIYRPPSVTENTTRLLDRDDKQNR